MQRYLVVPKNCPRPVLEALRSELATSAAGEIADGETTAEVGVRVVVLAYCYLPEHWDDMGAWCGDEDAVVAMVTELEVDQYARALTAGATGVVHFDTPASTVVGVIAAAARGEVVLPLFAAYSLASRWADALVVDDVTDYEKDLLRKLAAGERINDIAEHFAYSDRTIRRHLQSIYMKLGAANRYEAVRLALQAGLG